tara:strand:+ start:6940 stop:7368 length:429 start_codon:yes stop_codon:yes gene_type:complete
MKLIDFIPDHAVELQTHLTDGDVRKDSAYIEEIANHKSNWSLTDNGHLIFSSGVYPLWDGVGEAWFLPALTLTKNKLSAIKIIRKKLEELSNEFGFRRIQATCDAEIERDIRFAKFFGFQSEGRLRRYGLEGQDYIMMARLF